MWRRKCFRGEYGTIAVRERPAGFVPVTAVEHWSGMKQLPPHLAAVKSVTGSPERPSRPGRIDLELKNGIRLKLWLWPSQ